MSENTAPLSPESFDVEAWLADAHLPEESADVFKGGHLIGELSALKRRIENEDVVDEGERTAADKSTLSKLEEQYVALLQAHADTMLTVYVRALTGEELRELRAEHDKRTEGMDPKDANIEFGYGLLSAAIVGMKPAGGERKPVSMSNAQVKALERSIGAAQMNLILGARQTAQNAVPVVDADFLQRRSGTGEDATAG